jgi:hypothetical protein
MKGEREREREREREYLIEKKRRKLELLPFRRAAHATMVLPTTKASKPASSRGSQLHQIIFLTQILHMPL